jgi:hypothetical protein
MYPRNSKYFVPVGERRVLISLATDLDESHIAKEIDEMVNLCPDNEIQDAVIMSFSGFTFLKVDKTSVKTKLEHTELLDPENGFDQLIDILSKSIPPLSDDEKRFFDDLKGSECMVEIDGADIGLMPFVLDY